MPRTSQDHKTFRHRLLRWYDKHARDLPWRARPGVTPDPYHVWLSEIMLQQTTVGAVKDYYMKFLRLWPNVQALAAAKNEDVMEAWAGLGYYSRARNLHKTAQIVAERYQGVFPGDQKTLQTLPGIGDYTGAAIAAIAFNRPATVMDGNIERVAARYFSIAEPLPRSKPLIKAHIEHWFKDSKRPGDLAQALMDLGAAICIPGKPRCMLCPVNQDCLARRQGIAETLPVKAAKKTNPHKYGHVYWVQNSNGEVLIHQRPAKGLLGGMKALPTSGWGAKETIAPLPFLKPSSIKNFQKAPLFIHHTFTHFDLSLELKTAQVKTPFNDPDYIWVSPEKLKTMGMPTVFKKALKLFLLS